MFPGVLEKTGGLKCVKMILGIKVLKEWTNSCNKDIYAACVSQ